VQWQGVALTIPVNTFILMVLQYPLLAYLPCHDVFMQLIQLKQASLCQCFHSVAARLALWLLMSHDRSQQQDFHLTHQFMADMLGVMHSAITLAAGQLQKDGVIHYSRGNINVLSR
jgi:CRP-like cAMP-binding protein